jgi:hypothetical protein
VRERHHAKRLHHIDDGLHDISYRVHCINRVEVRLFLQHGQHRLSIFNEFLIAFLSQFALFLIGAVASYVVEDFVFGTLEVEDVSGCGEVVEEDLDLHFGGEERVE